MRRHVVPVVASRRPILNSLLPLQAELIWIFWGQRLRAETTHAVYSQTDPKGWSIPRPMSTKWNWSFVWIAFWEIIFYARPSHWVIYCIILKFMQVSVQFILYVLYIVITSVHQIGIIPPELQYLKKIKVLTSALFRTLSETVLYTNSRLWLKHDFISDINNFGSKLAFISAFGFLISAWWYKIGGEISIN